MIDQLIFDNILERVKQAKEEGSVPRVHGNGFIQLDIIRSPHIKRRSPVGLQRLHVWGPQIPFKQTNYSGIHNHVFDFNSTCIVGEFIQTRLDIELDADNFTHYTYRAVCYDGTDDTVLERVGTAALVSGLTEHYTSGNMYEFKAGDFHETDANIPTATWMTVTGNHRDVIGTPYVLCDKDLLPSNDFTRYQDPDILWRIIFETLG